MSALKLVGKTYPFLVLQLLLNIITIYPIYRGMLWDIGLGRRVAGMESIIVDISFAYIGFALFFVYVEVVRRAITHVMRYAQVSAMTHYLTETDELKSVLRFGFSTVFTRFGSISLLFVADKVLRITVREIGNWVMTNSDFIPETIQKSFIARYLNKIINNVFFHTDEAVFSYLCINPTLGMWEGIGKGTLHYFKAWKTVLKEAFVSVLKVSLAEFFISVITLFLGIWFLHKDGWFSMFSFIVVWQIMRTLIKSIFIEPYLTASILIGYYQIDRSSEEADSTFEEVASILRDTSSLNVREISSVITSPIISRMSTDSTDSGVFRGLDRLIRSSRTNQPEPPDTEGGN